MKPAALLLLLIGMLTLAPDLSAAEPRYTTNGASFGGDPVLGLSGSTPGFIPGQSTSYGVTGGPRAYGTGAGYPTMYTTAGTGNNRSSSGWGWLGLLGLLGFAGLRNRDQSRS